MFDEEQEHNITQVTELISVFTAPRENESNENMTCVVALTDTKEKIRAAINSLETQLRVPEIQRAHSQLIMAIEEELERLA